MYALIMKSDNSIIGIANKIEWGVYDEPLEKWALYDEENKVMYYVAANNTDFEVKEITSDIPEDFYVYGNKYLYDGGNLIQDPEWTAPPKSEGERLNDIEDLIRILTED